jgi:site-specific DNA-methyltransferase (adenine-specific)
LKYPDDFHNKIICGDCLEVIKDIPDKSVDLVLTDPPYPDYHKELYSYKEGLLDFLNNFECRQLIFWSAKVEFPLDYTAIHIWDKKCGVGSMYKRIFERNGGKNYRVFRYYLINSTVAAKYTQDVFTGHKSQKPIKLIRELIEKYSKPKDTIFDPFVGSGTTAVACKSLGRRYIGIEISPKYCEIAKARVNSATEPLFV